MSLMEILQALNRNYLTALAVGVVLIIAAIKETGRIEKRLLPLVAMAIGVVLGVGTGLIFEESLPLAAYDGLIAGILAAGGYDTAKTLVHMGKEREVG